MMVISVPVLTILAHRMTSLPLNDAVNLCVRVAKIVKNLSHLLIIIRVFISKSVQY